MTEANANIKQYLSTLGKKGGQSTMQKHGRAYFQKIGKLAAEKRWGKKAK